MRHPAGRPGGRAPQGPREGARPPAAGDSVGPRRRGFQRRRSRASGDPLLLARHPRLGSPGERAALAPAVSCHVVGFTGWTSRGCGRGPQPSTRGHQAAGRSQWGAPVPRMGPRRAALTCAPRSPIPRGLGSRKTQASRNLAHPGPAERAAEEGTRGARRPWGRGPPGRGRPGFVSVKAPPSRRGANETIDRMFNCEFRYGFWEVNHSCLDYLWLSGKFPTRDEYILL